MAPRIPDKQTHRDRDELVRTLREQLSWLRERYGVRTLALFGSYAQGTARATSDVDLLVEFEQVPSLLTFIEIELYLTDLIGVKVDLVRKDGLKPAIGRRSWPSWCCVSTELEWISSMAVNPATPAGRGKHGTFDAVTIQG